MIATLPRNVYEDLNWMAGLSRAPRKRSLREFAEQELVIPDGPYQGRRFKVDRQPYTGLLLDAIDSGHWRRIVLTGPSQSGKTLIGFVLPIMYHLFEYGETVVCGIPDMDMAADKWNLDLLPAIVATRFRDMLPQSGAGSRGGRVRAIRFRNGATLRFMSGGGSDKSRAGFTTRVVVITETDGMDESGEASREADKISQLEARTRSYGSRARIYMECTVSIPEGRTWQELKRGTDSLLEVRCPACEQYVAPEREHLVGWQAAAAVADASASSRFVCPACGETWDEAGRRDANLAARLQHRRTDTDTLGFRWSAVHNLFVTAADLGADEWRASREHNEDNAQRRMKQFVWAIPHEPPAFDMTQLDYQVICDRVADSPRGYVPHEAEYLTVAVDLGKHLCHWVAMAFMVDGAPHVVEYGVLEVPVGTLGEELGLAATLNELHEMCNTGWPQSDDKPLQPARVLVDSGWRPEIVYRFVRDNGERYLACKGYGTTQQRFHTYKAPKQAGGNVAFVGEGYHVARMPLEAVWLLEYDSDHWKSHLHQRVRTPLGQAGALTLYRAQPLDHLTFAKHLTAERQVEEFVAGKGRIIRWEQTNRNNHYLDAAALACCAGHVVGVRLMKPRPAAAPSKRKAPAIQGDLWLRRRT